MTVDEAINRMMTCAPATHCSHEDACFLVARTLHKHRREQSVANEADETSLVNRPEKLPDLEVADYAPAWECIRRPLLVDPLIDWSAS